MNGNPVEDNDDDNLYKRLIMNEKMLMTGYFNFLSVMELI